MKYHISLLKENNSYTNNIGKINNSTYDSEWIEVICAGQNAIYHDGQSKMYEDVSIVSYLFTPDGIRYTLKHP